ncbi:MULTISPECIES: DUF6286 domain-containing protein [Streptomyces]|uniref:DUF6286 domain-containing protein n=1 Tax=Streptomyces drozdowiczii TaxID=202862 RepID=A0ABY6PY38_9ACTN|nr:MULTISPECIES: DUF6286 domain-containing protein [Streptomyces]MCX0243134.1 DUF6286 domain-containing protein [Streptomyces drozdowiczii]OKJ71056.1 hypothetical protein AMK30_25425 [Streptomyces sp. CB02460]UZK56894.1 DUF6286 domain-containing protein [Streptomyces drozdowiczii]
MTEPHDPDDGTRRPPEAGAVEHGSVLALDQSASSAAYDPVPDKERPEGGAGRFWSARRIPAGIVAAVVLGASGLLLYDVSAVRAGHPAMQWRRTLADELATRKLDDVWVLTGASVAAALGLWLLLLALTPGLRDLLPMRREHTDVRAALDRTAAAMVLRDRAVEVAGVQSVRVRMGRSKVGVRALSHFRELDDVRADLDTVLSTGIRELGLARQPRLSVQVRRPAKKG